MAAAYEHIIFAQDPFLYLDAKLLAGENTLWVPGRQLYIGDATAAREILANRSGLFREHSDFFDSGGDVFKHRSVQIEVARKGRLLLQNFLLDRQTSLPNLVEKMVISGSNWPDTGNWLMYHHMKDAILCPTTSSSLINIVKEVVTRAILSGARQKYSRLSRALFRQQIRRALSKEIKMRRKKENDQPSDILDILITATAPNRNIADLCNTFLAFLFAMVGSIGFLLSWCLYLIGTHPKTEAEALWIVKEALRLWPIAWNMDRRPNQPQTIAGIQVNPQDHIMVCPYAVHRNPQHWQEPQRFYPQRWAGKTRPEAFMPFGWGKHTCVAATLSMRLVEEIITLLQAYRFNIESSHARPLPEPALAPPPFILHLR